MAQASSSGYRDLRVWQSAIELAKHIYLITKNFPKAQEYGLVSQLQRSAVSIASNIAEGSARNSHQEFIRFLSIASGSLAELVTQLIIAREIGFISEEAFQPIHVECDSIGKMLNALKSSIREIKSNTSNHQLITNNQ